MTLGEIEWHGQRALCLESDTVTVTVLPDRGAKIASIVDGAGHEWLAAPVDGELPAVRGGDSFTDAEMCGWDDMVPTLQTRDLPDHGEVWSAPCDVISSDDTHIETEFTGVVMPYTLRRNVQLSATGFTVRYAATTNIEGTAIMWVAHPQFAAPVGIRVEQSKPRDVGACPDGPFERRLPASFAPFEHTPRGQGKKYWCDPADPVGTLALVHPGGERLSMRWDPRDVPYVSVWVDNAWKSREPVVAFEPATGFGADIRAAAMSGRAMTLTRGEWSTWELHVDVERSRTW